MTGGTATPADLALGAARTGGSSVGGAVGELGSADLRRFKQYPVYKDSGVEWLGPIPAHWDVTPIRSLARLGYKTFTDGDWIESPFIRNEGIRLLQTGNIGVGTYKEQGFRYIDEETLRSFRCTEVLPGDVLICRLADPVGRACLAPDLGCRMITSVDVCILKTAVDIEPAFVVFALSGGEYLSWMSGICRGGTRDRVSRSMLGSIKIQIPQPGEQRAIVAFLDRETARIDALVTKKERLIELLRERRTALIARAVTKGLDPNVPMKESGVEWLGEIPAHWDLVRVGRVAAIGNGSTPRRENQEYWSSGEHPWLSSRKVNDEIISEADEFVTDAAIRECHLPRVSAGSVLVAITGEGQTRGRVGLLQVPSTISQHLAFITPRDGRVVSEYLWRVLQSQYEWLRNESGGAGSTRAALTCEYLKSIKVPVPPRAEQRELAEMIGTIDGRFASLVHRVSNAIDRLKELRIALISAGVTGKIDVRDAA